MSLLENQFPMYTYVIILTCLLQIVKCLNSNEILLNRDDSIYDIFQWVSKLNLQTCTFIEIGLKYFAIFVEDGTRHYFLGICNFNILTEWKLCSTELLNQRKSKCCLKLRKKQFSIRVHRRFCDIKLMMANKDCICTENVYGEEIFKVIGFPTCYVAPSPTTLCRYYNACGLSQCKTTAIEGRVYAVECSPYCKGRQPFCEYPFGAKTSVPPKVTSFWSKWRQLNHPASHIMHSRATCINKYTRQGAVDCLGPGTGCCPEDVHNCSCETFIDDGILYVDRKIFNRNFFDASNDNLRFIEKFLEQTLNTTTRKVDQDLTRNFNRIIRDVEEYDDDSDDIEDDIEIEETDEETPSPTTEELEKDEIIDQVEKELESEIGNSSTFDVLEANNSGLIKAKQNNVDKTLPNQLLTLLCCVIFVIINNI